MAKIVYTELNGAKPRGGRKLPRPAGVTTKRVRGETGGTTVIYQVDAHSPTLAEDLGYVFTQNVRRAKREHKRLTRLPRGADKA